MNLKKKLACRAEAQSMAIGYRVRSHRGTQFRKWATEQLKTYLTQGFLLDDERFKRGEDDGYLKNLLARIRVTIRHQSTTCITVQKAYNA